MKKILINHEEHEIVLKSIPLAKKVYMITYKAN